jgi:hypothetical protein
VRGRARRFSVLFAIVSVALATLAVSRAPGAHAAGPVTEFSFVSSPGDYIGAGVTRDYVSPTATITAVGSLGGISMHVSSGSDNWTVQLSAPPESQLHPGSYPNAQRSSFRTAGHPGVDVYGNGRGCNQVVGSFTVYAISSDADGNLTLFDGKFTQHCETAGAPPMTGVVKYEAPASAPITVTSETPSVVRYQPVRMAAHVADATSGSVTFSDGATTLGTAALDANGLARFTTSALSIGDHAITASYNSDSSAPVTQTVRDNDVSYWFSSPTGDYVGAGATESFVPADTQISVSGTASMVQLSVTRGTAVSWYVIVQPPTGQSLHVGSYSDTASLATSTQARLDSFGDGRGCNNTIGAFDISAFQTDGGGAVTAFAATFTQHCESVASPPQLGTINFHGGSGPPPTTTTVSTTTISTTTTTGPTTTTTAPTPPHPVSVSVSPASIAFGAQRVGTFNPQARRVVTVTNPGNAPVAVTRIGFAGANPSDFFGSTDCRNGIRARVLAPHTSCHAVVAFGPLQRGRRTANLVVFDSSGNPPRRMSLSGTGTEGYYIAGAFGEVGNFGDAVYHGDATTLHLAAPMISLATTPNGAGYWLLARDGGIFSYGNAHFYGSTGNIELNRPVVAMAASPNGKGYRLAASDGGIFAFGDARFYGSTGNIELNQPINGMAATADDRGYWLVAADGGIFAFGDAHFYGSAASAHLTSPVVQMAPTPSGHGYWILTGDGHLFTYGDAHSFGSATGHNTVGLASTPDGRGYWEVTRTGQVFAFGDATSYGDVSRLGVSDVIGIARTAPALPPALLHAASAPAAVSVSASAQPNASRMTSGVNGVRSMLQPTSASASATALKIAGGEPMAPPSPMPLWPPGVGDGVSTWPYSMVGTSVVVGSR